jgi:hypothetical protein
MLSQHRRKKFCPKVIGLANQSKLHLLAPQMYLQAFVMFLFAALHLLFVQLISERYSFPLLPTIN